jgi:hypothetical protein
MSITRNILNLFNTFSDDFKNQFDFYLDILDKVYSLQSQMGLNEEKLSSLDEEDQNIFKSYLFLVESSNTTSTGALRLLSSNLYSDAYSLIRILYEIACLLHYGNLEMDNKREIYYSMFKSGLPESEHNRNEWKLIQKAEKELESTNSEYVTIRKKLNNFGGHISRTKIILGNVTTLSNATASNLFTSNFSNRYFLAGLDFLFSMSLLILDEYRIHLSNYNGVTEKITKEIKDLPGIFLQEVRPKLQSYINPGSV